MRVLVVEDELKLAKLVRAALIEEGIGADVAVKGEDALWMAKANEYDAIVLDVGLPGADGFEVCRRLRADGVWSPVLMLTARDSVEDRVAGLDGGADDYLTKPFEFPELFARLRAIIRRGSPERPATLEHGDLTLEPASREVRRAGTLIELSAREYSLLETLMREPGVVFTRIQLLDRVWGDQDTKSNVVDVYVRYLRAKIDEPFGAETIETVRGAGYRLRREGP